jgi:hypothetical protein
MCFVRTVHFICFTLLICLQCGAHGTSKKGKEIAVSASPVSTSTQQNLGSVSTFAEYATANEWILLNKSAGGSDKCNQLHDSLRKNDALLDAARLAASDSPEDQGFGAIVRCASRAARDKADVPVPNNYISGLRDFGDRAFVWFQFPGVNPQSRPWDIVYGEFSERSLQTNEYFDGYTVIDLHNCSKLGGVPIQRQLENDIAGTPRDVMHALIDQGGAPIVLVASEQVGRRNDPGSLRSVSAWALDDKGAFKKACSWKLEMKTPREKGK